MWGKTMRLWACALLALGLSLALCISGLLRLSAPALSPGESGVLPLLVQDLLATDVLPLCGDGGPAVARISEAFYPLREEPSPVGTVLLVGGADGIQMHNGLTLDMQRPVQRWAQ